jgi:hypothetical protein
MGWGLILLIGEIAKLFMIKKQKYFTPIRIIGMLLIFVGIALRKISTNDTQFAIIGGLFIAGLLVYIWGWDRKRITENVKSIESDATES